MKKILFSLAAVTMLIAGTKAQVTINQTKLPSPGDVQFLNMDTVVRKNPGAIPTNIGASQSWDFSFLASNKKDTISYLSPNAVAHQDKFPSATVVARNKGVYTYYRENVSEFSNLGNYQQNNINDNRTADNKANYGFRNFKLPITFGTAYADTQRYISNNYNPATINLLKAFGITVDSMRYKHYTIKNVSANGYGAVKLSGSFAFSKTLRVRDSSFSLDSIEFYSGGAWKKPAQVSPALANYFAPVKDTTTTITWYADSAKFYFPAVRLTYKGKHNLNSATFLTPLPAPLNVSIDVTNASCHGDNTGAISAAVAGGTSPYTYKWSNNATTALITGLAAGNYSITVTDAAGASVAKSSVVSQPAAMTVTVTTEDASKSNNDGAAYVKASGGATSPFGSFYTYKWDAGGTRSTMDTIFNLPAGTYTVIVTDVGGCTAAGTGIVHKPSSTGINSAITLNNTSNAYPNPFADDLNIDFILSRAEYVTLRLTDVLGKEIVRLKENEQMSAGKQHLSFDTKNLQEGLYLYQLQTGNNVETRKINHIKN